MQPARSPAPSPSAANHATCRGCAASSAGRPAAREAPRGAQMLGGVILHADEQVEAVVADAAARSDLSTSDCTASTVHGGVVDAGQVEHRLGRLEREAALEHRQLRQRRLLGRREQVPRPVERGAQRRLAVQPAALGGEQLEALAHAREQHARRHHAHARRGQFDGQRQAVEQAHQRRDRPTGRSASGWKSGFAASRTAARTARRRRPAAAARSASDLLARQAQHLARRDHEAGLARRGPASGPASPRHGARPARSCRGSPGSGRARRWRCRAAPPGRRWPSGTSSPCATALTMPSTLRAWRQIAEPDAARKVAEPAPAVARHQARLAGAADAEHRHQARARVDAARQLAQGSARPTKASRSAGRLCRISRTGSHSIALAHDAIGLVGVGRRQEGRVGRRRPRTARSARPGPSAASDRATARAPPSHRAPGGRVR